MFRKYLARLLAFVLVLNVLLCAPLRVGAEEGAGETETFDADPVVIDTAEQTVTVTEDATLSTKSQTVSVEIPTDTALSQTPVDGSVPKATEKTVEADPSAGGTSEGDTKTEPVVEYDAPAEGEPEETVHVEEAFDLDVDLTNSTSTTTDIQYEISLDQKTTTTSEVDGTTQETTAIVENVDQTWNTDSENPKITVNMSVNGMKIDPTRVEHIYTTKDENGAEESHTEYYYNEANGKDEADTSKKYFSVIDKVVSLVTNFLGKFNITNKPFEDENTKQMSSNLDSAVNNAGQDGKVNMLRDTSESLSDWITKSNNVTVDLNGHDLSISGSIYVKNKDNQKLTIENGTIKTTGSGIITTSSGNEITLNDVTLKTAQNKTADGYYMGIWDEGANNQYTVKDSTIDSTHSYWGIYHNGSYGGAKIELIGSYVIGASSAGIYVSGSTTTANRDGLNSLTLTDSVVESETGAEVKFTNVTIDNSKLVGFGTPPDYTENNNGSTTTGAALAVTDNANGITGGTITINSGYFYGHKDIDSIFLAAKLQANDPQATIQLNGGRFVQTTGLYKLTDDTHAVISLNDGSEYPYEVVATGTTPTRSGYTFQGFKDENGKAITLEQAIEKKAIAYAQWEKIVEQPPVEDTPAEVPAETVPAETAPANNAAKQELIIVEADSKGNNVDIAIQDTTAVVTVSNPDGDAAAVSEVTIPSVAELKKQGVETVSVQVEENVTLELNLADAGNTLADSVKVTRDADILVISSGEQSEIVIHMTELKAAASEPVRIQLSNRVLTIHLGGDTVYQLELADDLAPGMTLTVKLEDGILKLYDKDGNLVREVKL